MKLLGATVIMQLICIMHFTYINSKHRISLFLSTKFKKIDNSYETEDREKSLVTSLKLIITSVCFMSYAGFPQGMYYIPC